MKFELDHIFDWMLPVHLRGRTDTSAYKSKEESKHRLTKSKKHLNHDINGIFDEVEVVLDQ